MVFWHRFGHLRMTRFARLLGGAVAFVAALHVQCGAWADVTTVETVRSGVTLLGRFDVPGTTNVPERVVLLVHGTFAHKDMEFMRAFQAGLSERGIASLSVTLSLGHDRRQGMLDCALPIVHRFEDAAQEIESWVGWLKSRGVKQVIVAGHSRGGAQVALYLARSKPDAVVKRAILVAPLVAGQNDDARDFEARHKVRLNDLLKRARAQKPGVPVSLPGLVYCVPATATPEAFLSYHGPETVRSATEHLRKIGSLPVLVIGAGADTVVRDLPKHMAALSAQGNITFKTVNEADHMFLDFFAEDAVKLMVEFIK